MSAGEARHSLITSSSDRQAGFLPSISRTSKKNPCRWKGWWGGTTSPYLDFRRGAQGGL